MTKRSIRSGIVKAFLLALGIGIGSTVYAQDNSNYNGNIVAPYGNFSSIENTINREYEKYSVFEHSMKQGESLESLQALFKTHFEKLEWLLGVYNEPLSHGDFIRITETQTDDGFSYPHALEINYMDPKNEDILFIAKEAPFINNETKFAVKYNDISGNLRRIFWQNKKDTGLFDVDIYDFRFVMDGFIEDYRVTSIFGLRDNHFAQNEEKKDQVGGMSVERVENEKNEKEDDKKDNHLGTDFGVSIGTLLYSPVNGFFYPEYIRLWEDVYTGKMAIIETEHTFRIGRKKHDIEVQFWYLHLSDYDEQLKQKVISTQIKLRNPPKEKEQEFHDWYYKLLSDNELNIVNDLKYRKEPIYRIKFASTQVEKNQKIALSGDTGKVTAAHLHLGIKVNGKFVDPVKFYDKYGIKKDLTLQEIIPRIIDYQNIVNYQQNK